MSRNGLQPEPPKGPGYLYPPRMCISSAIAISKMLILLEHDIRCALSILKQS